MAYHTYISHVDERIRETLAAPTAVAIRWTGERTVTWTGDERFVRAELRAERHVEFLLHRAPDEFPYDRFADDLIEPDIATTARKVAEFFNEAEPVEPA